MNRPHRVIVAFALALALDACADPHGSGAPNASDGPDGSTAPPGDEVGGVMAALSGCGGVGQGCCSYENGARYCNPGNYCYIQSQDVFGNHYACAAKRDDCG